jgi:hypothetical protein
MDTAPRHAGLFQFRDTIQYDGAGSGDIGGNLEIVPPFSGGTRWQLGRVIYGNTMNNYYNPDGNPTLWDDWDWYHRLEGEVHCGTAARRTTFGFPWWEKLP